MTGEELYQALGKLTPEQRKTLTVYKKSWGGGGPDESGWEEENEVDSLQIAKITKWVCTPEKTEQQYVDAIVL